MSPTIVATVGIDKPGGTDRRHSADDLVQLYDRLAIPHFQRGLVWGTDSVALLLESAYLGTPCGSILLWQPKDPAKHGVALGEAPTFLIIDGQQRIRSLHDVFGSEDTDKASASDEANDEHVEGAGQNNDAVWCVNLARLPLPEFADRNGGRFRLFGLHRSPLLPGKDDQSKGLEEERRPLLPLRWFLDNPLRPDRLRAQSAGTTAREAVEAVLASPSIIEGLRRIRTNALFDVRVLGRDQSLKDVVSAYNRINSAGKRVEAEERAFATLVSVTDKAESALKTFFDVTRGPGPKARSGAQSSPAATSLHDRDDLLHREKESRFGFKLFMRAFVINFAYQADRTIGSSSFSFDSIDTESLEAARDKLAPILESTVDVIAGVARLLRERLYCDDLRTLPETASLWPVFQCAIRFPRLLSDRPEGLAAVALRLILADLTTRELLTLASEVNTASSPAEALAVFEDRILLQKAVAAKIQKGVDGSQSLTNRYALLLYWLLRKRGARDFSYKENGCTKLAEVHQVSGTTAEVVLSESVTPEKQHLVPYRILKALFALSGARPGQHEANDIGNLTYISGEQNGLDGLSSTPLNLRAEPVVNLQAHFLEDERVLRAFDKICRSAQRGSQSADGAKKSYRKFCADRRRLIAGALVAWDEESRAAVALLTPSSETPQPRLIASTMEDRLRLLGYPLPVTNAIIRLFRKGFREGRGEGIAIRLAFRRKGSKGKGQPQLLRVDLPAEGGEVRLKVADPELQQRFSRDRPTVTTKISKGALRCSLDTMTDAGAREAAGVLEWVSSALADLGAE